VYMSIVVWIFSSHISWQHARLQTRLGLRFQNPDTILLSLKLKNLFNQPFDSTLIILCKEMKSFH
jgi:competence transcription factor ComK